MSEKNLNIPNSISFFRLIILTPLVGYFYLQGDIYNGFILSTIIVALDGLDGLIARKFKQQTSFGAVLDVVADNLFLIMLALIYLYLGYLNLWFIFLIAIHRFTRLLPVIIIWKKRQEFYIPIFMKITGISLIIYLCFIPLLVKFYGQQITDKITLAIFLITYIPLLISVILTIRKFQK